MSAGFTNETHNEDKVRIKVSADKMEAYLISDREKVSRSEIDRLLASHNITHGIREDVIDKAASITLVGEPLLIARGSEPVNGEDARIEFLLKSGMSPGKPQETVDGRVDFYNLDLIKNVGQGEVIAVKYAATEGTPGCTVTGEQIPPKPGKDIQFKIGKNVNLVPGEEAGHPEAVLAAVAAIDGHVVTVGNRISVSPVYEVRGDVDFNTGNIEFKGTVVVSGTVREGFRVTAEGDVIVMGTVSDAVVESGGNVNVRNGIVGVKSRVKAKGSVSARFIENALVECGEDVIVGDAILHSRVSAGRSVTVSGKGVIAGGTVRAGEEIRCVVAGSGLAAATELEAGINPELRDEYFRLKNEIKETEKNYEKADKALKLLNRIRQVSGSLTPDKQALLLQLTKAQVHISKELNRLRESLRSVEESMRTSDRGRIAVQGTIRPGVKVTIGSVTKLIKDPYTFVSLTRQGNEIKFSPYR